MRLSRGISVATAMALLPLTLLVGAAEAGPASGGDSSSARQPAGQRLRTELVEPRGNRSSPAAMRAGRLKCGDVITRSTTLVADIGPCPGDGIIVGADNINLNLNGHMIFGTDDVGAFAGIRLPGRMGVTITGHPGNSGKTGTVTGFDAGIVVRGGSSNVLTHLVIRDNVGPNDERAAQLGDGIYIQDSPNNSIFDNVLTRNGRFDGIGVFGVTSSGTTIQGNEITDTIGFERDEDGFILMVQGHGVIISGAPEGGLPFPLTFSRENSVIGNWIEGNNGSGVLTILTQDGIIAGNTVNSNGAGIGLGSVVPQGRGYFEPTRMLIAQNVVTGNRSNGISVATQQNRILNNVSTGNALDGPGRFDLSDGNVDPVSLQATCDDNVWFGNTWGPFPGTSLGSYSRECVTTGGSGPRPSYFQP